MNFRTRNLAVWLAVLLQLLPMVRTVLTNPFLGTNVAFILRWGIGTGAALGAFDSISRASLPVTFINPTNFYGNVGIYFTNNLVLTNNGADGGAYFVLNNASSLTGHITNNASTTTCLPPGLTLTFHDNGAKIYGAIYGTPTAPVTNLWFHVQAGYSGAPPADTNVFFTITPYSGPQPPAISVQPLGRTNANGSTVQLSVTANGTSPLNYRWLKNALPMSDGAHISGTASNVLTLTSLVASNSANYSVIITNVAGSVTSSVAQLLVLDPPAIFTQPADRTNNLGENATFGVVANGTPPLSFNWFKNGIPVGSGAAYNGTTNSSNMTLLGVTAQNAGSYYVVATNFVGSVTSRLATLIVLIPPAITSSPTNQTVAVGSIVTLAGSATGSPQLQYQWFKDNNPLSDVSGISGSTSNVLTLQNVTPSHAGNYFFTVSNSVSVATSSNATLTVLAAPVILSQTPDTFAATGSVASLSVQVDGAAPLAFRWLRNNLAITNGVKFSGVASNVLAVAKLATNDSASFVCIITNNVGSVTSSPIALTVQLPVAFTLQASNRAVKLGSNTVFRAAVRGTAPFVYQWLKNGSPLIDGGNISGSSSNVLVVTTLSTNDNGSYTLSASNNVAGILSSNALLTVLVPPSIIAPPTNLTVVVSNPASFSVDVGGTAPFKYQWKKFALVAGKTNITLLKGATNSTFTLLAAKTNDAAGYFVIITNRGGAVTSSIAKLTVLVPVSFTLQASNRAVKLGSNTVFRAAVKGTGPYSFQWFKDGNPLGDGGNISGSASNVLSVSTLTTNNNGAYTLVVSNMVNMVTSPNALLTVLLPPVITVPATNQSVLVSNSVTFAVVVDGTAPFKYQWLKGKTAIKGATNAAFTIASAKLTDAATNYLVIISNRAGSATNPPVTLTVLKPAVVVKSASLSGTITAPPGEISIIAGPGSTIVISFIGTPNASYTLESNDSLDVAGWQILGTAAAQADGTWQMTDTVSGTARFYRVRAGAGN